MALQPQNTIAPEKTLLRTDSTLGEGDCCRWQGKLVPMPMKGNQFRRNARDRLRRRAELNREPTNFWLWPRCDRCSKGLREQLRPQANANKLFIGSDRRLQPLLFRQQPRIVLILIDIHRPTHDDRRFTIAPIRQWISGREQRCRELMTPFYKPRGDRGRPFKINVLNNFNPHGRH